MALTLGQIVTNALEQIGHSSDAQKTSEWIDRFKAFANEAQLDLARHVRKKRTDDIEVVDGKILRTDFPREVLKVSSIKVDGTAYGFSAEDSDSITVAGLQAGTASVTYEYAPADMKDEQEYPDVPGSLHAAIPQFISYRYYMTNDQGKAMMFKNAYEEIKNKVPGNIGGSDQYSLLNVFS